MKYLKYYEARNVRSSFPSEEFENAIGMSGLSEEYILPKGYDYDKIYNMIIDDDISSEKIEKLYYKIVKLNPELEAITIYGFDNIYSTMQGICSKFLIQDIIIFNELFNNLGKQHLLKYNFEVSPYKEWIYKNTGVNMGWVPCFDTLKSIIEFVKNKKSRFLAAFLFKQ
jgi:hypothetical protein